MRFTKRRRNSRLILRRKTFLWPQIVSLSLVCSPLIPGQTIPYPTPPGTHWETQRGGHNTG